jgi:cyclophilin family peptidyl-prolyl cis-trans isomerase
LFYLSFSTGGPDDGSTYTVVPTGAVVTRKNGGNIPDELVDKTSNEPGTLSMANTGQPNTGGRYVLRVSRIQAHCLPIVQSNYVTHITKDWHFLLFIVSQFFVNTVHNDFLDHWRNDLSPSQHPVFGKVVSGMDIVMKIGKTKCDHNDNPVTPVMMKTITIA